MKKYTPHIAVFLSSIGVMVIELTAGRLVSKYFGTSLYTWTGVIGVVLGGISLGNFIGGRLADRYTPVKAAGPVMLIASGIVFLILVLDILLDGLFSRAGSIVTSAMVGRSVLFIFVLFFLPASGLGTLSPIMAKYALELKGFLGKTVGNIYAIGAAGSIIGTFLAGFVL
ncbi:MAG: spermidine synthase, partial [Spirochaetales bacterium]